MCVCVCVCLCVCVFVISAFRDFSGIIRSNPLIQNKQIMNVWLSPLISNLKNQNT